MADQLTGIYQQVLGRVPTSAEVQFLQPYIDGGFITAQQIGQYLGSTPEALQTRLATQQAGYTGALTANNSQVLSQAADAANASFAQNGRQFSTGQGNSVIQAGQELAAQQSPMIANFYGQGQQALNSAYNTQGQGNIDRAYNLQDSQTAYDRQMQMYYTGQNDYNNYLNQQNRLNRQSAIGGAIGGGIGAAAGAYFGGPAGALAGARVGSGIGSGF